MAAKQRNRRGGRINHTGRTDSEAHHVRLYHWMLKSPAWKSLKPLARSVLIEVWARYNGQNNGEISYGVREAGAALGVGKDTANKAFWVLEERGFLKARERGSFHWKGGLATEWEITALDVGDRSASKDFMKWQPEKQNPVPVRGTDGPPERDREAKKPTQDTLEAPPTVPVRGTTKANDGPCERDTSILPAGEARNAVEAPTGIHSKAHKNVRCEASEDDLALPAFLDRRSRSQQIEEPAII